MDKTPKWTLAGVVLALSSFALASDRFDGYSLYFLGLVKHVDTAEGNKEGNMQLFGISREDEWRRWSFETGGATYIDTYRARSYMIFSNISHKRFTYRNWKPMLSLTCTRKGEELNDPARETICAPIPKFRVGKDKGLFANVTLIPKYKDLTNGFAGVEIGYKF